MAQDHYREFRSAVDRPDERIDLGYAALAIASTANPGLDISSYLARIDELAAEVKRLRNPGNDLYHSLAALNYVLFNRHGFRGNRDDYYDPKNSFLHEVLDRKLGIPISLSVLYMEVARRISINAQGVGFPGHFLVKCDTETEPIFIDPFHRGEIKLPDDLSQMLESLSGRKVLLRPEFLEGASKKQILKRMLANLKAIYLGNDSLKEALSVLDQLIILDPAAGDEIRDRGTLYLRIGSLSQACDDFERYLQLAPDAPDAATIREQITTLARERRFLH